MSTSSAMSLVPTFKRHALAPSISSFEECDIAVETDKEGLFASISRLPPLSKVDFSMGCNRSVPSRTLTLFLAKEVNFKDEDCKLINSLGPFTKRTLTERKWKTHDSIVAHLFLVKPWKVQTAGRRRRLSVFDSKAFKKNTDHPPLYDRIDARELNDDSPSQCEVAHSSGASSITDDATITAIKSNATVTSKDPDEKSFKQRLKLRKRNPRKTQFKVLERLLCKCRIK